MPKTRKNIKSEKGKNKKTKDLEDLLEEEELNLDPESETDSDSDSDSETDSNSDSDSDTSISKELNKMMNETIDSDLTMPAIGLGLVAIIGFALYKGIKV